MPIVACGFLVWMDCVRAGRVEYVSGLAGWSVSEQAAHVGWQPRLIVPENDNISYEWLDQVRQMFSSGSWRVRFADYENVPFGHDVLETSPYRWWLGLVAWSDHFISGQPIGPSLERAALFADPLVHLLVLVGTTVFVAWRFGAFPAMLLSIGVAAFSRWLAILCREHLVTKDWRMHSLFGASFPFSRGLARCTRQQRTPKGGPVTGFLPQASRAPWDCGLTRPPLSPCLSELRLALRSRPGFRVAVRPEFKSERRGSHRGGPGRLEGQRQPLAPASLNTFPRTWHTGSSGLSTRSLDSRGLVAERFWLEPQPGFKE